MALKLIPYKNKLPQPVDSRWVYLMSGDGVGQFEHAWKDLNEQTKENKRGAYLALDKLKNGWITGQLLEEIFDRKICHDVHTFSHLLKPWTIYSFKKTKKDVIRLYFIYGPPPPNGMLIVIKIDTKDQQKLTSHQKENLEKLAKLVINLQSKENEKLINSTE